MAVCGVYLTWPYFHFPSNQLVRSRTLGTSDSLFPPPVSENKRGNPTSAQLQKKAEKANCNLFRLVEPLKRPWLLIASRDAREIFKQENQVSFPNTIDERPRKAYPSNCLSRSPHHKSYNSPLSLTSLVTKEKRYTTKDKTQTSGLNNDFDFLFHYKIGHRTNFANL